MGLYKNDYIFKYLYHKKNYLYNLIWATARNMIGRAELTGPIVSVKVNERTRFKFQGV